MRSGKGEEHTMSMQFSVMELIPQCLACQFMHNILRGPMTSAFGLTGADSAMRSKVVDVMQPCSSAHVIVR